MLRSGREELFGGRKLDDLAEVHDGDAVGDVAHDGEVVGDEEVRQVELLLQLDEQVEHLRLIAETSSAETGSSATMNFGRSTRARARPIRWRWPPPNWCG